MVVTVDGFGNRRIRIAGNERGFKEPVILIAGEALQKLKDALRI
jgi:hypothetical protein